MPTNTWVHLAFVAGITNTQLYANGAFQGSLPGSVPLPLGQIGTDSHGDRLLGLVDELSIYNRALSSVEIQNIYLADTGGKCPPPVFTSVSINGTNGLNLNWSSQPGITYRFQYATTLSPSFWMTISGDITATNTISSITLPANTPTRYYRVEMLR